MLQYVLVKTILPSRTNTETCGDESSMVLPDVGTARQVRRGIATFQGGCLIVIVCLVVCPRLSSHQKVR